jgi:hypothetical protein
MAPEACGWPLAVLRQVGELDSVVCEHGMDVVRNGFNERLEEGRGSPHIGLFHQFNDSKF